MSKNVQVIFALGAILIIALAAVFIFYLGKNDEKNEGGELYCNNDIDCAPESCCHANSCVNLENKKSCTGVFCTQSCEPGTLDCGQGSCLCVNNKCEAVLK